MNKPLVSIIMGSDSDLPVMQEAAKVMEEFSIDYEILVLSAHRSPEITAKFAKEAVERGIKVIIAGAGGAAHLAGVISAHFSLPVIGVPVKSGALNGVDSLYSIVQMPPGIPVATVAINGAKNAGLLAVEILATSDEGLRKKIVDYKKKLAETVENKNEKLKKIGYQEYIKNLK